MIQGLIVGFGIGFVVMGLWAWYVIGKYGRKDE